MDHLTSSQINLYLQCSLKYKYQYCDRLPKPFRSSALVFGSAIHSALSWLHQERMRGNHVSIGRLYKIFDADWFSQIVETEIHYRDGEEALKLVMMGKEMLGLYFSRPAKNLKGSEIPFTVPLIDRRTGEHLGINLEGFFDLIEADDTIVKFKTSAHPWTQDDVWSNLQLTTYGYAFELLHGRPPRGFKVIHLVKEKKPYIEEFETTRDKTYYEAFLDIASQVLKGITSSVFPPRPGFWCKECEYKALCPIWNGGRIQKLVKVEL